jgi:hypothetical protein
MTLKDKLEIGLQESIVSIGKRKGMLKAKCPPMDTYGSAVWTAVMSYSNPYKVGMGHLLFMGPECKELYDYVRSIGKTVNLSRFDRDGNVLRDLGIF